MVERKILSFEQDESGEWRVLLDCGHKRHLRHDPPRESRPELSVPTRREAAIGQRISCGRCEQRLLPDTAGVYKSTPVFTQDSIPPGLLKNHSLKQGTWGKLLVLEGLVVFCEGELEQTLREGQSWTVLPEVVHHLKLQGPLKIRIDFLKT